MGTPICPHSYQPGNPIARTGMHRPARSPIPASSLCSARTMTPARHIPGVGLNSEGKGSAPPAPHV
jgi:hypothetical protein